MKWSSDGMSSVIKAGVASEAPSRRASVCSLLLRSLSGVAGSLDDGFEEDDVSSHRKISSLKSTNETMIQGLEDILHFVDGGMPR